jgi:hypothetical protein
MSHKAKTSRGLISKNIEEMLLRNRFDSVLLCAVLAENFSKINDDRMNQKTNYYIDAVEYVENGNIATEDLELLLREKIAERLHLVTKETILTEQDDFVANLVKEVSNTDTEIHDTLLSENIEEAAFPNEEEEILEDTLEEDDENL